MSKLPPDTSMKQDIQHLVILVRCLEPDAHTPPDIPDLEMWSMITDLQLTLNAFRRKWVKIAKRSINQQNPVKVPKQS